jgi:hypothetical protein
LKKNDASTVRQSLEVYSRLSIGEAQVIYDQVMLKFPVLGDLRYFAVDDSFPVIVPSSWAAHDSTSTCRVWGD